MADLSDVVSVLAAQVTDAVIPGGTSVVAPTGLSVMEGWPLDSDLDTMLASYLAAVNAGTQASWAGPMMVSVFNRPHMFRNRTRYIDQGYQPTNVPTPTLTIAVAGSGLGSLALTIGGTAPGVSGPVQNVGAIVGFGSQKQPFVYQTVGSDTLNSIAANLAALINTQTPASAAGPVVSIPNAVSLIGRIGIIATVGREDRRQCDRFDINVWAPSPALRNLVGKPIRQYFAPIDFLTLPDNFQSRILIGDDCWIDDPVKIGLFRRCIGFDIEYPTTDETTASEIIVFQTQFMGELLLESGGPILLEGGGSLLQQPTIIFTN